VIIYQGIGVLTISIRPILFIREAPSNIFGAGARKNGKSYGIWEQCSKRNLRIMDHQETWNKEELNFYDVYNNNNNNNKVQSKKYCSLATY
jgi:hypothetical protein